MDQTTANPSARRRYGVHRYGVGLALTLLIGFDQLTKQLVDAKMALGDRVILVEGYFQLRYSRNPGAFFSIGESLEPTLRRIFFVAVTVFAIALMARLYRDSRAEQRSLRIGVVLLLSGAVGNLIDRLRSGEVIDFLHMHYQDAYRWATYNVADIYICAGLALLAHDLYRTARQERAPQTISPPSEAS